MSEIRIDALLPGEMATRAEYLGVRKAEMPALMMFTLAILAGAFISLGAIFATTVSAGGVSVAAADGTAAFSANLPYGVNRLLTGLVFCLGLILVVVGGAELFTGNNLIVMAWASRKVSTRALLRNWGIVYAGNFVGAIGTAILMLLGRQYTFGASSVGVAALKIAVGKTSLDFWQALVLGILCNALVCLAVWLTYSARSVMDKIMATIFPITAFVAMGFEHSIANMYFIPYALFIQMFDPAFTAAVADKVSGLESLTWSAFFFNNLLPVTVGNIIGGAGLVAAVYWFVFLYNKDR
ncbi:MAG: formate/nitrite transporter family protein [Anaerolineales bacterium]|nr:formate/nitrite transporter family protein [Anaerolineales bacterium]MCZ2289876.1 formate/nitrite transporter family protein [Anaerolineales bacterium]